MYFAEIASFKKIQRSKKDMHRQDNGFGNAKSPVFGIRFGNDEAKTLCRCILDLKFFYMR